MGQLDQKQETRPEVSSTLRTTAQTSPAPAPAAVINLEQLQRPEGGPQNSTMRQLRTNYFDDQASKLAKLSEGRKIDFGDIGWVGGAELIIEKLIDRSQAPNVPGVNSEFAVVFNVRRAQEVDGKTWRGMMHIETRYDDKREIASQSVVLFPGSDVPGYSNPFRGSKPGEKSLAMQMPDAQRKHYLGSQRQAWESLMKNAPDFPRPR